MVYFSEVYEPLLLICEATIVIVPMNIFRKQLIYNNERFNKWKQLV